MRLLTISLTLFFLLGSCSGDRRNFKVQVDVNGSGDKMLYLAKRTISGSFVVDSAMPEKPDKYILRGFTEQPDFYVVYYNPGVYINLVIHPGDDFRVLTDAATFDRNYIVEGSADSRLIQKMVNMQIRTLEKITRLTEQYENSRNTGNFGTIKAEIDTAYERVFNEHKQFSIDLIRENPGSLATLMTLYQQLGRNTPVFDYKRDFKYYVMVDSSLSSLHPNSEAVIDLNRKVSELRDILKLQKGAAAPEIALPDSSGRIIKLSSLKGKKVVLLFWASWSSKSLSALNGLGSIYKDIRADVEYYQVSIDRTRESWLRNLTETGIHVSDIRYWDSPVIQTYQIEKLPVVYLLDENGVIIANDTEPGNIFEILKNK